MYRAFDAVKQVSILKRNLISLSILDSKWYMYTIECEVLKVSRGARVLLNGHRKSHL